MVILLFCSVLYFQGKKILENKFYLDLAVATFFYGLAFYYAYGYVSDWEPYNPLDLLISIFEPIGTKLFFDILGL